MKILFATVNYGDHVLGGGQISIQATAEEFVKRGFTVGIVSVHPTDPRHTVSGTGIHQFKVPPRNMHWHLDQKHHSIRKIIWHTIDRTSFCMAPTLGDVIDEFQPDIVHSNVLGGLTTSIWSECSKRNIPVVHTVHDYYLLCLKSGMRKNGSNCHTPCTNCSLGSTFSRKNAKLVNSVIYVSKHMQRIHEASNVFSSNAHSSIIYGSYIPDTAISRISTTTKLRLGFLGRLAPDKGLDRVFGELASLKGIDFHLEIGGTGNINYVSYLQSLSNKLPVTFLGKVKPETFLSGIDLLIVPSLWNEPAGRVVFEAGICGVPSIVADRGGLPELAGYGNRGWIYDPDNCGELAAIITKICEHKETICDKATQWQLDAHEFDPVKVADKTLAIYNQLIKR